MPNGIARDRQHKPVGEGRREENSLTPPEAHMRRGPPKRRRGHPWREGRENKPKREERKPEKERLLMAESQRRSGVEGKTNQTKLQILEG